MHLMSWECNSHYCTVLNAQDITKIHMKYTYRIYKSNEDGGERGRERESEAT